jgi:hypothetical protein
MLIPHLALFFDTSFISEAHLDDIKLMIEQRVEANYITDGVYCELRDGYLHNQCDERFSFLIPYQKIGCGIISKPFHWQNV